MAMDKSTRKVIAIAATVIIAAIGIFAGFRVTTDNSSKATGNCNAQGSGAVAN